MFAVMKTGGKQYRVQPGDVLRVEKLAADAGEMIQFNEVLMVGSTVGAPMIAGAGVQAEVIDQIKGPKTINFVKRRRKHSSKRTKGHRQKLTLVRIKDILEKGADKSGVKAAIGAGSVPYVATPVVEAAPEEKSQPPKKPLQNLPLRKSQHPPRSQLPQKRLLKSQQRKQPLRKSQRLRSQRRKNQQLIRSNHTWHIKKQVVHPVTAAIQRDVA